ncbi:glutathione S-transferase Mu 1-like [Panonychus citri]|uniref:glutathione S-transferase Mu 1-like n=1 Tax=Panonychus citri TaxID=50023 RepID=UPI00230703C6|nr:glutathione S-transferase Mu 1-like [Panonychus citri]
MAPVLGYWKFRGLCEPIRLLLAHVGQEYEMKSYSFGPEPDFDRSEWLDEKFNLNLDFPNLPYYIDKDEGVKITQTVAILRYLARKHGLVGKSFEEITKLDIAEQFTVELDASCAEVWYSRDKEAFKQLEGKLSANLPVKLSQLAKFIGKNQYLMGDRITYVDFMLYSILDYIRLYDSSKLEDENVSTINNYLSRIEALPGIKKYLSSEDFSRFPFTEPTAQFGSSKPSK